VVLVQIWTKTMTLIMDWMEYENILYSGSTVTDLVL
jgi:hypothetical protein